MAIVRTDSHRHIVLEVMRGEKSVAFVTSEGEGLALCSDDRQSFDRTYCFEVPMGKAGIEPTPRHYARIQLAQEYRPISVDAAKALLAELALDAAEHRLPGSVILTAADGKLIGSFEGKSDAVVASRFYTDATIVASAEGLAQWPAAKIDVLKSQVAPTLKAKGSKLTKELFTMALAAPKVDAPAPKRVQKVAVERPAKADGPVAKIRAYIDSKASLLRGGGMTRVDLVDNLKAMDINKGTIGVQVPKYLKELGIEATKGSRAKTNGAEPGVESTVKAKGKKAAVPAAVETPVKAKGKKAPPPPEVIESAAPVKAKGKKAKAE